MINSKLGLFRSLLLWGAIAATFPNALAAQEPDCSKYTEFLPLPPCGSCHPVSPGEGGESVKSRGRTPTTSADPVTGAPAEQPIIDAALAKIAAWEAGCPDLPKVPAPPGVANGEKLVSDLLAGETICIETILPKDAAGATTSPPPGLYYPDPPHVEEVTGGRIQVHPKYVSNTSEEMCVNLAVALVHEAFHLNNPVDLNASEREKEEDAYMWQADYLCKLIDCLPSGSTAEKIACINYKRIAVVISGKPLCLTMFPCEHCPVNVSVAHWNSGDLSLPIHLQGRAEQVDYSAGIGGGIGTFMLDPSTKIAEATSISLADTIDVITIDFASDLVGFQPTSFHPVEATDVQRVGVAGYNEQTGDGMLVLIEFDFLSNPSFVISTLYSGSGFSIPLDIFAFANATSKVFVLDTTGAISLVNLVPGTCTTVATVLDAASLANCSYLHGYKNTGLDSGNKSYRIVATEIESYFFKSAPTFSGAVVNCFDIDMDGVFEEIRER